MKDRRGEVCIAYSSGHFSEKRKLNGEIVAKGSVQYPIQIQGCKFVPNCTGVDLSPFNCLLTFLNL